MINNLRLVVIDNPFASWDSPFVTEMFNKIILLKKHGYQSRFPIGYTPIDKTDFHATHFCLCEEVRGELFPITAFRAIEKKRCEQYAMTFSGLTLCDSTKSKSHISALKEFVDKSQERNIAYLSSFTVNPQLSSENRKIAIEFLVPLFAYSHIHWGIERSLALGSCRTHTDKMYYQLGLRPLRYRGKDLKSLKFPCYAGEEFEVQCLEELSPLCIEQANKHIDIWKSRIHVHDASVGHDIVENYLISAAALTKMSA